VETNTPIRILVVDDEESLRFFLRRGLTKAGYAVDDVADGRVAIERLSNVSYDIVLTDLVMPEVGGLQVLSAVHEMDKDAVVILMTAHGSVQNAIDALRLGAFDYLTKPFEFQEVLVTIERGLDKRTVERENRKLRFLVNKHESGDGIGQCDDESQGGDPHDEEDGLAAARRDWERTYMSDLLRRTGGNVTRAANLARISRPNFHKKMRALGIHAATFKR